MAQLLLGIWLICVGITWAGWASLSNVFLGVFALITGIVWLVEGYRPFPRFWDRQQP